MDLPRSLLVLGGARSGKSAYAEGLLASAPALYVATGQAFDGEMEQRIRLHQDRRGPLWHTIEEPLELVTVLQQQASPTRPILVDCLTLWISNLMFAERDVQAACDQLCHCLTHLPGQMILVSSEVGLGLVPETSLGRQFRDAQGRVNQQVAQICRKVVFIAAGLPLILKDHP